MGQGAKELAERIVNEKDAAKRHALGQQLLREIEEQKGKTPEENGVVLVDGAAIVLAVLPILGVMVLLSLLLARI